MFSSSKYKNGYLVRIWFHPQLFEGARIGLVLRVKRKTFFLFKSGNYVELEKVQDCKIEGITPTYLFDAQFDSIENVKEMFRTRFFDKVFDSVSY